MNFYESTKYQKEIIAVNMTEAIRRAEIVAASAESPEERERFRSMLTSLKALNYKIFKR